MVHLPPAKRRRRQGGQGLQRQGGRQHAPVQLACHPHHQERGPGLRRARQPVSGVPGQAALVGHAGALPAARRQPRHRVSASCTGRAPAACTPAARATAIRTTAPTFLWATATAMRIATARPGSSAAWTTAGSSDRPLAGPSPAPGAAPTTAATTLGAPRAAHTGSGTTGRRPPRATSVRSGRLPASGDGVLVL